MTTLEVKSEQTTSAVTKAREGIDTKIRNSKVMGAKPTWFLVFLKRFGNKVIALRHL